MKIGIIGAGFIGRAVARLCLLQGHEVMLSNSRAPQTLMSTVAALRCRVGTAEQAAQFGELVVIAIPFSAYTSLQAAPLVGKVVLDANNYYPMRDGRIAELDEHTATTSGLLARHLAGAKVVKAFNAILQSDLEAAGKPLPSGERRALPIAGDDADAKQTATVLLESFGFDVVDAGSLADSWRFERAMPVYCVPLNKADLVKGLAAAQRGVEVPDGSWRP